MAAGVAELAVREGLEEGRHQEHEISVLVDDHAGGLLVGELRVEREAEAGEEVHRALEIVDRQVDEELTLGGGHGGFLGHELLDP